MIISQFNARGPQNGIENWFDEICLELENRGHEVRQFWLRGKQPTQQDIKDSDFALFHFSQVALYYRRLGIPYCILPSVNDCFPDNGDKLRNAASYKLCRFVTFQGEFHRKKFIEWKIPKPKVYVPMPVRTNLFKRRKPIGDKIIAGGRLIPKKGLNRLKNLSHKYDITIFGDGPLKNDLKNELKDIELTGHLNGNDLRDLMDDSYLFLFPSMVTGDNDQEGFPNIIKESLLMQLNVMSSRLGGTEEIKHIQFADDWSSLDLDGIDKEPNIKGERYIRDNFSPEVCVDRLLKGIEEFI